MKSTLLTTVAIAGLLALPGSAFAAPPDTGMVQANVGFGWTDNNFSGWQPFDDPISYGARTQWLFPLSKPVEVQTDFFAQQIENLFDTNNGWNDDTSAMFGAAAHLIHPTEHGRLAVAGSLYDVDAFGPSLGSNSDGKGVLYALVALEGQYFLDKWTLLAQGGWFSDIDGCDGLEGCVHDGFFLRGAATHFFSPYMQMTLDGNLFFGDDEFFGRVSGGTARLEGEYMFEGSRFAAFVGVSYESETVNISSFDATERTTTVDAGIRMYLDQMSLIDFSQDGPSLNTPNFHHALASEGTLQVEATAP